MPQSIGCLSYSHCVINPPHSGSLVTRTIQNVSIWKTIRQYSPLNPPHFPCKNWGVLFLVQFSSPGANGTDGNCDWGNPLFALFSVLDKALHTIPPSLSPQKLFYHFNKFPTWWICFNGNHRRLTLTFLFGNFSEWRISKAHRSSYQGDPPTHLYSMGTSNSWTTLGEICHWR